ncbi:MarR family winged helix-turn-helix transcriptional regulator [Mucilaginibacter flavidus]|uniref:MarR family winged helix-turn-helix transcriptional regulator n=1 Tax=Mucilaginibacter flavidus TaxID=2949309 RepID=UPI002091EE37|nr:MarR family transcriptional regulator [Mucilaginibacter flavidus]MCO5947609.1 MarR family transcriptional regulator [Mucilaginibacter flavidus]
MIDEYVARIRAFNRFYTSVIGLLDKYLDSEFSLTEVRIIFELYHHPDGMTASDLIDLLNLDKGYLSRLLQNLEKKGLILKKQSEQDGRVFKLQLSSKGSDIFWGLNDTSQAQVKDMLSRFTEADIMALTGHMEAIRNIFENRPHK